jgi:hypothetical protein
MRQMGLLLVIFGCLPSGMPDQAGATAYECQGRAGSSIFTDDPTGLPGCRLLSTISTPASPEEAATPGPISPDSEKSPAEDPPVVGLDLPAETADSEAVPEPADPGADPPLKRDPEYGPPGTVVAPSAQTCARGVNRLNPFGGGPCDPAGASAPIRAPLEGASR